MRILYLDCRGGVNAVAALAAMIDAGADASQISRRLRFVPGGCTLRSSESVAGGLRVRRIDLSAPEVPHAGRLDDVRALIERCRLSSGVRELVLGIYQRLAVAEARVHGSTSEAVTFHEVGAARSVLAMLGSACALEILGPDQVIASPLPAGGGMVETDHGLLPVPTPGTLELLRDLPVQDTGQPGELVTPSGAALVAEVASSFGPLPSMVIEGVGYGTDGERTPSPVTRLITGRT